MLLEIPSIKINVTYERAANKMNTADLCDYVLILSKLLLSR